MWSRTDWAYVDDLHNGLINNDEYYYGKKTLEDLNRLWKKYSMVETWKREEVFRKAKKEVFD